MSATPLLNITGLTASVDEKTILQGIDLTVGAGETHVLMGPNGAGKSTMGHVIMGDPVYTVNEGTITFDGADITDLSPDKRSRAGLFLSFQAPVEIPGVPLSSFLRAQIAGRPGLEMKGKEFRRRVKELAAELTKLYAARARTPGYAFAPDSPWMKRFLLRRIRASSRAGITASSTATMDRAKVFRTPSTK